MNKKKIDKNKILAAVVVVVLIFFFVGGFVIGLDRVRSMEGTYPEPVNAEGLVKAPETKAEALNLLDDLLDAAMKGDPSLSFDDSFSFVDNEERPFTTDGSDEFKNTLLLAKDNIISHISSVEESEDIITSVNFGEDFSELLRIPDITAEDVESFKHNMIVFTCLSCGETVDKNDENTEAPASCELCGSTRPYFEKYRDVYTVELVLSCEAPYAQNSVLNRNFSPRSSEEIAALTADGLDGEAEIKINNEEDIVYDTLKITFEFDRIKKEIISLCYVKEMKVSAEIAFEGDYAQLGSKNISFGLNENARYSFNWPSLTLSADNLVIEPGSSDNLLATRVYDKELVKDEKQQEKLNVVWTSSDESIATVDERGYISASKEASTEPVIITASFEFLGVEYKDTCEVYVRVPVESMKMVTKKVQLSVGETQTLEVKLSPAKATEQSVRWRSENEEIATVNEKGEVTAVAPGEVIIFAVSEDGDYKSTCEVSVK